MASPIDQLRLTATDTELAAPVAATAATAPVPVFEPRTMLPREPGVTETVPVAKLVEVCETPSVTADGSAATVVPYVFIVTLALLAAPVADTATVDPTPEIDTALFAMLVIEPLLVTAPEFVADCVAPVFEMSIACASAPPVSAMETRRLVVSVFNFIVYPCFKVG